METNRALNTSVTIRELYVFNSKFGNDTDNEMGKVLYCFPSHTNNDKQLKEIGLCEAIVKFAQTFNSDAPCESLHTLKARHVFFEPEPGYWMIMVLSIPSISKTSGEGVECTEYLDEEVQDSVFQSVLKRLYDKFVLLNDRLQALVEDKGVDELKLRLRKFYDAWVQKIDPQHCGITDIFRGIQFLPLTRDTFLRIQCFINNLTLAWPQIKHVVLMQREKLIWSGVDHCHAQLIYDYLVNDLLSQHFLIGADRQSTFGVILKRESHLTFVDHHHQEQVSGSQQQLGLLTNSSSGRRSVAGSSRSRLHSSCTINSEDDDNVSFMTASSNTLNGHSKSSTRFHMMIYKAEQTYLSVLIPDSHVFDRQLISKLEAFFNVNFTPVARDLLTQTLKVSSSAGSNETLSGAKYIYFNNLNFAEKLCPGYQCDTEAYKLLADLKQDLSRMNENGEIITKMVSENWLVAKVSNKREFYAIFNQKNSNVLEIDEEMHKLTEAHLSNIFFQE